MKDFRKIKKNYIVFFNEGNLYQVVDNYITSI